MVATRNERFLPAEVQDILPVPPEKVCPALRSATLSRGIFPRAWPETPPISSRFRSWDRFPTVTATPTVTCSTMMALAVALPCWPTLVALGLAASSAVMPARYWRRAAPAGTRTVNAIFSRTPAASVTVRPTPASQQAGPEQGPVAAA